MPTTPIPRPLPVAQDTYSKAWMDNFTRNLEINLIQLSARQQLFGTTINLNQLPTSATGLRSGDIWQDPANSHVLKVVP